MRRVAALWGLAALLSAAAQAAEPVPSPAAANIPGNLLRNASFEALSGAVRDDEPWGRGYLDGVARSPFAHWGYSGFWDSGDYDIKYGPGHTGKRCVRLVCRAKGRGGIASEALHVSAGTQLEFRGWFKAVGAKGGCQVNFEGAPGDGWANIRLPDAAEYDWTEVTGVVTVPKPKKVAGDIVEIYLFIYTRAYGELWIDDLTLRPMSDARLTPAATTDK